MTFSWAQFSLSQFSATLCSRETRLQRWLCRKRTHFLRSVSWFTVLSSQICISLYSFRRCFILLVLNWCSCGWFLRHGAWWLPVVLLLNCLWCLESSLLAVEWRNAVHIFRGYWLTIWAYFRSAVSILSALWLMTISILNYCFHFHLSKTRSLNFLLQRRISFLRA